MSDEQYLILPDHPTPHRRSDLRLTRRNLPALPDDSLPPLTAEPVQEVARDAAGPVRSVPIDQIADSRYRTILPYAPTLSCVKRALRAIEADGYPPLPARLIQGRYEVLGHELLLDSLRARGDQHLSIRLVECATEEAAYCFGKRERVKHQPRPSHYELMRDVWMTRELEGHGITWTRVGQILGYARSTVSHAQSDGARITPTVVERAGIDELNPEHAERLRAVSGKRLRWAGEGKTEDDRAIRLALLVLGHPPEGATSEQILANQEQVHASVVRKRMRRDGATAAVAELMIGPGTTQANVTAHLREYRALIRSLCSEDQASEQAE